MGSDTKSPSLKILWVTSNLGVPYTGGTERTMHSWMQCCEAAHSIFVVNHTDLESGYNKYYKSFVFSQIQDLLRQTLAYPFDKIVMEYGVHTKTKCNFILAHLRQYLKEEDFSHVYLRIQDVHKGSLDELRDYPNINVIGYKPLSRSLRQEYSIKYHKLLPLKDTSFWKKKKIEKKNQILYLGSVDAMKGITSFIPHFLKSTQLTNKYKLKILGTSTHPEELNKFKELVLDEDSILWENKRHGDMEIKKEILQSKILIVPSECESFGNQIAEACLCGTPVVTGFLKPFKAHSALRSNTWAVNRIDPFDPTYSTKKDPLISFLEEENFSLPPKYDRDKLIQTLGMKSNKNKVSKIIYG